MKTVTGHLKVAVQRWLAYIFSALFLNRNAMTQFHFNLGTAERIFSVFAGAYLLLRAISKPERVDPVQSTAATYLLLRGATGYCALYEAVGKTEIGQKPKNVNIRTTMVVNRPRHQVYAAWRKLEDLPRFMKHLQRVEQLDEKRSEWEAVIPGGLGSFRWKSEIVKDDPGALLSWQSLPGSTIVNAGKIEFEDAGELGTELHVVISYHAPLGLVGEKAARMLNPMFEKMVHADVLGFKQYIENRAASKSEDEAVTRHEQYGRGEER